MEATEKKLKLIVFELQKEEYAIPVQQVRSIEKLLPITRVPNVPPHIKGVINLRGVITPIVDLRARFDIEEKRKTDASRIIITVVDEHEVGFIVDAANDVVDITEDQIEPAPEVVGSLENKYVQGVVKIDKRLFVCLDLNEILQLDQSKD
ncbi:chemotaxis protein CheW [Sutcliffiella horikoshii]|uniref:Chemotaxis protein CheW n=1 Tax=Sutcliffiella horikoshii TaxID=79883 RepID=A0A1Y0CN11_9BACI|nr:chemotaxis protein CheW [Sutcliffiella horikoshii]ART76366.1 chemotaxis protein CheW [Sutcliffiella horikoshii]TYS61628.1 chemotaxis protein CheW [Sutcliffiella horikoshii]